VQENGTVTQLAKLVASDPSANIWLGGSVAVDQNVIVVGAPTSDPTVSHTGMAYVFFDTNGQGSWSQVSKLNFDGNNTEAFFGTTVDVNGDRIVVGTTVGSAHVFRNIGNQNWSQSAKLTTFSTSASSKFGQSVTIAQNVIVVGAPTDDYGNALTLGSAIVFYNDDGNDSWTEIAKLTPSDEFAQSYGLFGDSVALSEDASTLVVGATGTDYSDNYPGAAYVFKKDSEAIGTWTQTNRLSADDGISGARFGSSVAISNNIVVVSAPNDDDFGPYSGSAYMFDSEIQETSPTTTPTATSTITPTFTKTPLIPVTLSPTSSSPPTTRPETSTPPPSVSPVTTESPSQPLVGDSSSNGSSTTVYVSAFVVAGIIIIALTGLFIHYKKWKQRQRLVVDRCAIEAEPVYPAPPTYPTAATSTVMDAAVLLMQENAMVSTTALLLPQPHERQHSVQESAILSPTYKDQVNSVTVALKKGQGIPYTTSINTTSMKQQSDDSHGPRYKDQVNSACATRTSAIVNELNESGNHNLAEDEEMDEEEKDESEFPFPNESTTTMTSVPRDPPSTYQF
jgi:hypothetical protein